MTDLKSQIAAISKEYVDSPDCDTDDTTRAREEMCRVMLLQGIKLALESSYDLAVNLTVALELADKDLLTYGRQRDYWRKALEQFDALKSEVEKMGAE